MWLLPPLLLLIAPGGFSMSGPRSVSGPRGGSAIIPCHYDAGYESYSKWWCRGEAWRSCHTLLQTTGSEGEVRSGRLSIQDSHRRLLFTVTIEDLRPSDQDVYWCGIQKSGTDLGLQVRVSVGPALPVTTHPAAPATTGVTEFTSPDPAVPATTAASVSLAASPPMAPSSNSSVAPRRSLTRFLLCNLHVVLLTVIKVPLLGSLLCALMWLSRSRGDPAGK